MYLTTFTGHRVDIFNMKTDDIIIEDIAHALSLLCRFGGHTTEFYSVAQHSVRVSMAVPREYRLEGLLHDATEAYVQDLVRPIKYRMEAYKQLERDIWSTIAFKYGLGNTNGMIGGLSGVVVEADNRALKSELIQFVNGGILTAREPFFAEIDELPPAQYAWSPGEAEGTFMTYFVQALGSRLGDTAVKKMVRH